MADLNALIAQGYQFQAPPDPFASYAKMQQLNVGENQNALAQYQLAQAKRSDIQANALNQAYASATNPETGAIDYKKVASALASGGAGSQIPAVLKNQFEYEKAQTEAQIKKSELIDAKLKQSRGLLEGVSTPQDYLAWHEANHADPVLGPMLEARGVTADKARAQIEQALQQPGGFEQLLNQSKLGVEKFAEMNKPVLTPQNLGGTVRVLATPGMGGSSAIVPGSVAEMTMTPEQKAMLPIHQGQLAVSQGQLEVAKGNLANAQKRLQAEMATGNLTPETVDFIAETYRQTGTLPPMGMGPMAAAARSKILTRAGELAMGGGQTAAQAATDVRTSKAENAGMTAGQRAVGTQIANVQVAANEANKMIEVAKPYVNKVNPTDYPVLNAAGNYVAKNTGDPNIVGLATSLNAIVNTYARAINPKGTATVSDKNHAREILNAAMSKGQLNEAFNVMNQEMGAALISGPETKAGMRTANAPAAPASGKVVDFGSLK
jgi:hypothetical protein